MNRDTFIPFRKPTSTIVSPKKSKIVQESSDNDNDDDEPTDNISGDEFIPPRTNSTRRLSTKGSRVFARWLDGNFYPGIIGHINGEK